jgi:hypothetical protein
MLRAKEEYLQTTNEGLGIQSERCIAKGVP